MIYVDSLKECTPKKGWRWTSYCHMFADSLDELHEFASKIGMRRNWFQDKKLPHYDLTEKRRKVAISLGAQEVPLEWVKNKLRERR